MKIIRPPHLQTPSDWVQRWTHLVPPDGSVLDVACGFGRHVKWFHDRNHTVTAVDQSPEALAFVATLLAPSACEAVVADIENSPWPFIDRLFDAVVVTNYLWRPLLPALLASLAPGGVLLYETFAQGNETVGKPSRPDFLLRNGELFGICRDLQVVAFEDGFEEGTSGTSRTSDNGARFVQRIVAVRPAITPAAAGAPQRYPLA